MSQLKYGDDKCKDDAAGLANIKHNENRIKAYPKDTFDKKASKVIDILLAEIKKGDADNKLSSLDLTKDDIALYTLDGEELKPKDELSKKVSSASKETGMLYEPFVVDFKNIIVMRLFGGDELLYVRYDDKINSRQDLLKLITEKVMEKVKTNDNFKKKDQDAVLQFIHKYRMIQDGDSMKDKISKGRSS
jgi:hypothetical protein